MSFLEAAFLAAVASAAIPVAIHLLNRRKAPPVRFPTLRFLRELQVRQARRNRITERAILLLRVAALVLLALALARPVLTSGALGRGRASRVFVIDNSMSASTHAGGSTHLERFRRIARALVGRMRAGDRAAVMPLHPPPGHVPALTENRLELEGIVDGLAPTYRSTPLVPILEEAVRLLAPDDNPVREIYVLSDLQASGLRDASEPIVPPAGVRVLLLEPRPSPVPNGTFGGVRVERAGARGRVLTTRVVAYGSGDALVRVALRMAGETIAERAVRADPRSASVVRFELPAIEGGSRRAELLLRDDSLTADNSLEFAVRADRAIRALLVRDPDHPGTLDPSYYLARALLPRAPAEPGFRVDVVTTGSLEERDLAGVDVVFLLGIRRLGPGAGARLGRFVAAGGGLLIAAGPNEVDDAYWSLSSERGSLLPATPGGVVRAEGQPFHLTSWREEHPVWASLVSASPPLRPDVPIFLAYRRLDPLEETEVLATFDSGDPALVVRHVGLGSVASFSSTLSASWTNLPLRFVFAPFVRSASAYLATGAEREETRVVGSPIRLAYPRRLGLRELVVEAGDGETRRVGGAPAAGDSPELEIDLGALEAPGLLLVREVFDARSRERAILVRPDPSESDTRRVSRERLAGLLPGAETIEFESDAGAVSGVRELTVGSELKNPLLIALLLLLVVEPLLSNRTALRRAREETGAVPARGDLR